MTLDLTFRQAVNGCTRPVTVSVVDDCPQCNGAKVEPGTSKQRCHYCNGTGRVRAIFGSVQFRDVTEPSLLEFGSVRVLPNIRVRSVRVLSSYGKMKVRFWFGSFCRVFGSVWFSSMRVFKWTFLRSHTSLPASFSRYRKSPRPSPYFISSLLPSPVLLFIILSFKTQNLPVL